MGATALMQLLYNHLPATLLENLTWEGAISSIPSPLGGQEFYTGSRYPTSLMVERALSSKTHFIEPDPPYQDNY